MKLALAFVVSSATLLAAGCNVSEPLPEHKTEVTKLFDGQRVQVNVDRDITREQCIALIEKYKGDADGGQVSVHKPAPAIQGDLFPWCYYNFDEKGIRFNDTIFKLPPELHDANRQQPLFGQHRLVAGVIKRNSLNQLSSSSPQFAQ